MPKFGRLWVMPQIRRSSQYGRIWRNRDTLSPFQNNEAIWMCYQVFVIRYKAGDALGMAQSAATSPRRTVAKQLLHAVKSLPR